MKQQHLFTGIIILLAAGIAYVNREQIKTLFTEKQPGSDTVTPGADGGLNPAGYGGAVAGTGAASNVSSASAAAKGLNMGLLLKLGSRNNEVKALQAWLNKFGPINPLVVDGIFGTKTEAKLAQYTNQRQITLQAGADLFYKTYGFHYQF